MHRFRRTDFVFLIVACSGCFLRFRSFPRKTSRNCTIIYSKSHQTLRLPQNSIPKPQQTKSPLRLNCRTSSAWRGVASVWRRLLMPTELPHQPVGDCQVRSCRQVLAVPARDRLLPIEGHGRLAYSGSELAVRDILSADVPLVPPLVLPQGGVASAPTGVQEGGDSRRHGPLTNFQGLLPSSFLKAARALLQARLRLARLGSGSFLASLVQRTMASTRSRTPGSAMGFRAGNRDSGPEALLHDIG